MENGAQASQLEDIMQLFDKYKVETEQEMVRAREESAETLANLRKDHDAKMEEVVSDLELRLEQIGNAEQQLRAKTEDYSLLSEAFYRSKREASDQTGQIAELQKKLDSNST